MFAQRGLLWDVAPFEPLERMVQQLVKQRGPAAALEFLGERREIRAVRLMARIDFSAAEPPFVDPGRRDPVVIRFQEEYRQECGRARSQCPLRSMGFDQHFYEHIWRALAGACPAPAQEGFVRKEHDHVL